MTEAKEPFAEVVAQVLHLVASPRDAALASEAAQALEAVLLPMHEIGEEVAPPPGLWDRIADRLDVTEDAPGTRTTVPDAGGWEPILPGLSRRMLYVNQEAGQAGYYLRFDDGAVLPSHAHDGDEHCIVISGRLQIGRSSFGPGTYHLAEQGQTHTEIRALEPTTVFILGAL